MITFNFPKADPAVSDRRVATVEQWWDRHGRYWVTERKNAAGYTLGDTDFSGTRAGAALQKKWATEQIGTEV